MKDNNVILEVKRPAQEFWRAGGIKGHKHRGEQR